MIIRKLTEIGIVLAFLILVSVSTDADESDNGNRDVRPLKELKRDNHCSNQLVDCFRLFNYCQAMDLLVEELPPDAADIGLTRDSVQTAVESRLRSARLFSSKVEDTYLYVNINVAGRGHSISLEFAKKVFDPMSGIVSHANTWNSEGTGTHASSANFILGNLSQHVDEFLVEFLRVNEPFCNE